MWCTIWFPGQYLAHTPLGSLSEVERRQLAVDVALAALVADGVFNFGEIIEHPIMAALAGTPEQWLAELLQVFHTGDVDKFGMIVAANRSAYDSQVSVARRVGSGCGGVMSLLCWSVSYTLHFVVWLVLQPALVAFDNVVKEKVVLVCVMELASQRAPHDKSIPFTEIAAATRMLPEQVRFPFVSYVVCCCRSCSSCFVCIAPGGVGIDAGHVPRPHPRQHR